MQKKKSHLRLTRSKYSTYPLRFWVKSLACVSYMYMYIIVQCLYVYVCIYIRSHCIGPCNQLLFLRYYTHVSYIYIYMYRVLIKTEDIFFSVSVFRSIKNQGILHHFADSSLRNLRYEQFNYTDTISGTPYDPVGRSCNRTYAHSRTRNTCP